MRIAALSVLLLLLTASTSGAITGDSYYKACSSGLAKENPTLCVGYTSGALNQERHV